MGSTDAKAYLTSPEVVAASTLSGKITGPGRYQQPEGWSGIVMGEGDGIKEEDRMITAEVALEKIISKLDSMVDTAESEILGRQDGAKQEDESLTKILPGFQEKVEGEIVSCDANNINTDGIYPGEYTYQDNVTVEKMVEVCMSNYDPSLSSIAKEGDVLCCWLFQYRLRKLQRTSGHSYTCQEIPLIVSESFGNIFSRNSIKNVLMGVEVPRLVQRLRQTFSTGNTVVSQQAITEPSHNRESLDSPSPGPQTVPKQKKGLTRRTGWKFTWDVR